MAFTVNDYQDLIKLLKAHPEWREELRNLLLPDELLALPQVVRELAEEVRALSAQVSLLTENQKRLTERVDALAEGQQRLTEQIAVLAENQKHLTERVDTLAEGQNRLIERVDTLTEQVDTLAEGQDRLTERVDTLTERVDTLTEVQQRLVEGQETLIGRVDKLYEGQQKLTDDVGMLKGDTLEIKYRGQAGARFGRILRNPKVVEIYTLDDTLEAALTDEEFNDLFALDLLVAGQVRHAPESPEISVAIEISWVVDQNDVERAVRRAELLRKAGYCVVPAVVGREITAGARTAIQTQNVVLMLNGQLQFWAEALDRWESIQV